MLDIEFDFFNWILSKQVRVFYVFVPHIFQKVQKHQKSYPDNWTMAWIDHFWFHFQDYLQRLHVVYIILKDSCTFAKNSVATENCIFFLKTTTFRDCQPKMDNKTQRKKSITSKCKTMLSVVCPGV